MKLKHISIVLAEQEELVKHIHDLDGSLIFLFSWLMIALCMPDDVS